MAQTGCFSLGLSNSAGGFSVASSLPALGVELEPYLRSKAKIDIMCDDVDFRIGIVVMRRMSFASSGGKRSPPLVFVSIGGV